MKKVAFNFRTFFAFTHDILAVIFSWIASYSLRFNFNIPEDYLFSMLKALWIIIPLYSFSFALFSLYRGTWRFVSLLELKRILFAVVSTSAALIAILYFFNFSFFVPRSIYILNPLIQICLLGGSRFIYRLIREHQLYGTYLAHGKPVVVLGSNIEKITILRDLSRSKDWRVVSILDDDPKMHGREILGIEIHGGIELLPKIKNRFKIRHAIILMPLANQQDRRRAINLANKLKIQPLTVPHIDDLMTGRLSVTQMRPVEVEDLLGRESVNLDNKSLKKLIAKSCVMVTGAGGSIGSELCRQLIKFKPSILICFDISEYALYKLENDLSASKNQVRLIYFVGDVKKETRVRKILNKFKPSIVFHAAAYKHVPMMEDYNVSEAFNNNTLGTYYLAQACQKAKIEKFVLISTDKAVNPTNIMGATKRLAEIVCQGLQTVSGTKFIMVRFGNVLGSSGSVIPKFREQIKLGGPITVTHPKVTRYFMSIPEAAQLVMQAGMMGQGGEIFLLDMGEPIKIHDLATDMIKLSGFDENEIKIIFTGLRPGEKLYEELLANDETSLSTKHNKLRIAKAKPFDKKLLPNLISWIKSIDSKDEMLVKKELKKWLKEYIPASQHTRFRNPSNIL